MIQVNVINEYHYRAIPPKMPTPRVIDDVGETPEEAPKYVIQKGLFREVVAKRISIFTSIKRYGLRDTLWHLKNQHPFWESVEHR